MRNDDRPSFRMRPEDYLCCVGVLISGIIALAASWTPDHATASAILTGGLTTGGSFVSLWTFAKVVRFFADNH